MLRVACFVAIAALIAGCGGSDESPSPTSSATTTTTTATATTPAAPPEVTRESYIAKADAFCKKENAKAKRKNETVTRKVAALSGDAEILSAIKNDLRAGYTDQRQSVAEFRRIPTPPEDATVIDKLSEASDEQTALLGRLASAAESGDSERFTSLSEEQDSVKTRYRGLAQGYGFQECGSGKNEAE